MRKQIPALANRTYLDSAGAGLPPRSVTQAMKGVIEDWSRTGEHWEEWLLDVVETRRLFAKLIGGKPNEVGVVPSVTAGLVALACSTNYSKRKKVVTSSLNFPTNIMLWQRMKEQGLLRHVEVLKHQNGSIPLEAYEKAVDDTTAIVSVDYVSWFSGYREQIREIVEIAHRHGALLIVDAFHALGVFPVDAPHDGIDALVSGFYKWLCGPHGVACVYVQEKVLPDLKPTYIGWHGVKDNVIERIQANRDPFDRPFPHDQAPPSATAARFEWGTWATVAVKGALEALRFTFQTAPATRFQAIGKYREQLIEGLEAQDAKLLTPPADVNPGGGIVTYEARNHGAIVERLASKRIIVSGRFDHIRVSPHFYNTPQDIDRLLEVLASPASK